MLTLGILLDYMQDMLTDDTADSEIRMKRMLNLAYRQVAAATDWQVFRRQESISTTSVTSTTPLVLPANLRRITGTMKDGDENAYYFSPSRDRADLKHLYNWYYADPVATPLASGTTLAVAANATSVTSTAEFPSTTCVGEFLRVGENLGVYEVATWTSTSAMTITDAFRGDDVEDGDTLFEVRPVGTPRIAFCDNDGTDTTPTTTITIPYTVWPLPLYNRYDSVLLPGDGIPMLAKALKAMAQQKGWTRMANSMDDEYLASFVQTQREDHRSEENLKPPTFLKANLGGRRHTWGL